MPEKTKSASTAKKKRSLKASTVDKWKTIDLATDNAELWLDCTVDRDGLVQSLRCKLCSKFVDDLKCMRDFSDAWISGSRNLKLSNPRDHATTKCHRKAFQLHANTVKKSTDSSVSVTLPKNLVDPSQPTLPQVSIKINKIIIIILIIFIF